MSPSWAEETAVNKNLGKAQARGSSLANRIEQAELCRPGRMSVAQSSQKTETEPNWRHFLEAPPAFDSMRAKLCACEFLQLLP